MSNTNEFYYLLKNEKIAEFNLSVEGLKDYDLRDVNLRGRNLQKYSTPKFMGVATSNTFFSGSS